MHFAIIGKHTSLSLIELDALIASSNDTEIIKNNIVVFSTNRSEALNILGGTIKSGRVVDESALEPILAEHTLLGTADLTKAKQFKKEHASIRRFKEVPLTHADMDIKKKWIELINLWKGKWGVVENYQNIWLYEAIDFNKPSSGMNIGMMPSKLAHILITIATEITDPKKHTVRDPFCGFGTTNFLANAHGYNTIGSDIKIAEAKRNHKRWTQQEYFSAQQKMTFFKHDVLDAFDKPFLNHVDYIVSEWRLWPTVSHKTRLPALDTNVIKISEIYKAFFENILASQKTLSKLKKIVITVPEYQEYNETQVADILEKFLIEKELSHTFIEETYARKKQKVGRKILIVVL